VAGDTPDESGRSTIEKVFYPTDSVRFVHWEQFAGAQPTVVLTGVITILAFITGLSNLAGETVTQGPLAGSLPGATAYAQFGGVLLAFLLGILTIGLRRRKRLAWYGTVVVLFFLALLPLTTLQATDVPLLLLVLITLPLIGKNRSDFDQPIDLSPLQVASLSSILGVVAYGTFGTYALARGGGFAGGESMTWSDAFYYVIVTIATVGYGDITPTTQTARWFSISIILFGTGAFTVAVGSLIVPAIESRMASAFGNMTASELTLLEDHVLVLGYGDITESLIEELNGEVELVVITDDPDVASELNDEDVNVLTDDQTDEDVLRDARIESAQGVVVATRDDATDVLAVLAARNSNPDVWIAAAANHTKNVEKFEQVGADEVISPMSIGGQILGRSVLDQTAADSIFGDAPLGNSEADGDEVRSQ
jgi:voltage-gated potassium channel